MAYLTTLLVIHVLGAVAGFGPTFAYAVLGPTAGKNPGPAGLVVLEAMEAIEKRFVLPVAMVIQPLTGILMIFKAGFNHNFFSHKWLPIAIGLYLVALFLALGVQNPAIAKMISLAKAGGGPEMEKLGRKTATVGQLLTVLLIAIVVLMVWKPGN